MYVTVCYCNYVCSNPTGPVASSCPCSVRCLALLLSHELLPDWEFLFLKGLAPSPGQVSSLLKQFFSIESWSLVDLLENVLSPCVVLPLISNKLKFNEAEVDVILPCSTTFSCLMSLRCCFVSSSAFFSQPTKLLRRSLTSHQRVNGSTFGTWTTTSRLQEPTTNDTNSWPSRRNMAKYDQTVPNPETAHLVCKQGSKVICENLHGRDCYLSNITSGLQWHTAARRRKLRPGTISSKSGSASSSTVPAKSRSGKGPHILAHIGTYTCIILHHLSSHCEMNLTAEFHISHHFARNQSISWNQNQHGPSFRNPPAGSWSQEPYGDVGFASVSATETCSKSWDGINSNRFPDMSCMFSISLSLSLHFRSLCAIFT